MKKLLKWWILYNVTFFMVLIVGGGRPEANAHPMKRAQVGPGYY